jgi:hypothetical protein
VNCAKDTLTGIRSKWLKKRKIRNEVRENEPLDERIEENISKRKMDHGKLNKKKNPLVNSLEHFTRRKERQAGEAWKMRVKLT